MKRPVLIGIFFVIAVLAVLIYSTMNLSSARVEVCMDFQGRHACSTAAATTKDYALRSATQTACAQISSGVTDTIGCQNTNPASVRWLSGK